MKGERISLYINFYDKNNNLIDRELVTCKVAGINGEGELAADTKSEQRLLRRGIKEESETGLLAIKYEGT